MVASLRELRAIIAQRGLLCPVSVLDTAGAGALLVATVSIISKEVLFRATLDVGKRFSSPTTIANAHHHRSDALSSVAALFGIGGSLVGIAAADVTAATVVGVMVFKMGFDTFAVLHE